MESKTGTSKIAKVRVLRVEARAFAGGRSVMDTVFYRDEPAEEVIRGLIHANYVVTAGYTYLEIPFINSEDVYKVVGKGTERIVWPDEEVSHNTKQPVEVRDF